MVLETSYLLGVLVVGIGATLIMDAWALLLRRAFNVASLNFCLVGRWLLHMPDGTFRHPHIAKAPERKAECAIGWAAHYLIGIVFALVLVIFTAGSWLESPSLWPALLVGIGTVVIPFFVMQPAFGLGVAAANTPRPSQARLKSLVTHAIFGLGLYASAVPFSYWLAVYV